MKLFDDKERVDSDPSYHNENPYDYYDRSARKDISNVRKLLNSWFSNYPDSEQYELRCRFKKTFSPAFYELFIYQLFKCQGFDIEIHPEIIGSNNHPDFLLKKGNIEFYLEAKEARDKSKAQEALDNKLNHLYDSLNEIKSPNFLLKIEKLAIKSAKQPSTKNAIAEIEAKLAEYDPDDLLDQFTKFGFDGAVRIKYEKSDLGLVVALIPKIPSARNLKRRPIAIYPSESFFGGSEDSIKGSFAKKSKRYGNLDKPYFICINAIGIKGVGDFDVENALWGSIACTWSTAPKNRDERWERMLDGIFLDNKGPRSKNVTGVLVTKVMEYNVHVAQHWFAIHPFSDVQFEFNIFDLSYQYVDNRTIRTIAKKTIGEVLGINPDWLEQ